MGKITHTHRTAPTAAYVHIPFCRRRCYYCDFAISVVGDRATGDTSRAIATYVNALTQEIATTPILGDGLDTVFFGGGTPSLLSVRQVEQVLQALEQRFGIAAQAEISMEMDPGTFDQAQINGYRQAGVNRVSLGVQSFQADQLAACGRTHTPADIPVAMQLLRQAGVQNISLDLISGLPYQTLDTWDDSLARAIALRPTHLSVYDLTVEPATVFARQYQPGEHPLPSDDTTAEMYRMARQRLTQAGFDHYEISNYARPGYQCRHNRVYWENRAYYGFGMAAASYTNGQRFTRPRTRRAYFEWLDQFVAQQGVLDCPPTPPTERLLDTLMVGLRLADGIPLRSLVEQFGPTAVRRVLACLAPYQRQGWVEGRGGQPFPNLADLELEHLSADAVIRLSDPEGFLFSNVVLTELFQDLGDRGP